MDNLIEHLTNDADSTLRNNDTKFTYIIGNNGAGKSLLLSRFAEGISDCDVVNKVQCIANTIYDKFFHIKKDKVVYLGLRNVNNAIFFSSITRYIIKSLISKVERYHLISSFLNEKVVVIFEGEKDALSYIDKRKVKKGIPLTDSEIERLTDFINDEIYIEKLTDEDADLISRYLDLNPNNCGLYFLRDGKLVDYSFLSSGEQNRFLVAVKILSHLEDNSVVIIDEPEISLHLHWQQEYHNFIRELVKNFNGIYVLIATHSPIIVSEAYKAEDSQAVIILDGDHVDNKMRYVEVKHGEKSYDSVVFDFFNTLTYKSSTVEEKIASILSAADIINNTESAISELNEIRKILPKGDERNDIVYEAISLVTKLDAARKSDEKASQQSK